MEECTLGRTGISASRLGLGLAALGRPGYINLGHAADLRCNYDPASMQVRAHDVLDAARAAGIRHFDAARSYGRAEEFLSSWLLSRAIAPYELSIASKWGYTYTAGWTVDARVHEVKEHTPATFERQLGETRALLEPWLRLYQVHSATLDSRALHDPGLLAAMARVRESGIHVGLTLTGPAQAKTLAAALRVRVDGAPLFATVQATWNVLEPSAEPALAEAHAAGLGVIVKEALANGRLTERNADAAFAPRLARLRALGSRYGCTLDALALAAALNNPWADVVLSGAATPAQLRSNATACAVSLDDEGLQELRALAEPADGYWASRSRLPWN